MKLERASEKIPWKSLTHFGIFLIILVVGTVATLIVGEVEGLARADLSNAPVQAMTATANNEVMYATLADASRPGIYRSQNNGRAWERVGVGPGVVLNTLAVHPVNHQVLYAGAAGGPVATSNNLWRSDDGGQTWQKFFLSLPGNVDSLIPAVTALAVDPYQPESLYVGTEGQGVYKFDVGREGIGYELVGGVSLYNANVTKLVVGPDSDVYALTPEGLYISRDDDDGWQKLDTVPEYPISLAVAPTDADTIYAGVPSSGAYRSTDGGRTWENIAEGLGLVPGAALRVTALTVDEADSWRLAAATAYGIGKQIAGGGIYESKDGGSSWTKLGDTDRIINELTFDDGTIHAVSDEGLVRYNSPDKPAPAIPFLDSFTQFSGLQLFMLALTTGLGALALVGQKRWM